MKTPPHIVIIGAGLIGLSTADELMLGGAKVTLIEARSGPAQGTSYSNSGMVHPSQAMPWLFEGNKAEQDAAFKAVLDLARQSKALLERKISKLNLWKTETQQGCYKIYPDVQTARAAQALYASCDIPAKLIMDTQKTWGHITLHFADDMWGNAYLYSQALAADLQERGATFIYEALSLKFSRSDNLVQLSLNGHIFDADHVIVCAGPQSPDVLSVLGIEVGIEKVRGFSANFARPDMALPSGPFMDALTHSAMTVFDDHVRFSGTVDEESARPVLKRWCELVPDVMAALQSATEIWSAFRPMSKVGRPYIGLTEIPNLWINAGHGHMGWTLSAGSGELMARMVLGGEKDKRFGL